MKKIMFYCQHILGIGHFVRSMEIVRGLVKYFQVCFINDGEFIEKFEIPPSVEVVNKPAAISFNLRPVENKVKLLNGLLQRQEIAA